MEMTTRQTAAPKYQPARTIYQAFLAASAMRDAHPPKTWLDIEANEVHKAACQAANDFGLRQPNLEEIHLAERYARGHVDYGFTWATEIVERMIDAAKFHGTPSMSLGQGELS